jgi:hypothetical protein
MSIYDTPLLIFGYLNGIHWQNLDRSQITKLETGYRFDENIEIIIANEELIPTFERFFQNNIQRFAWLDEKNRFHMVYTLVRLSSYTPNEFHRSKENPIKQVELAFRLYKRGLIINNIAFSIRQGIIEYYSEKPRTDYLCSHEFPWGQPYNISINELDQIQEIFESIKRLNISEYKDIQSAVRSLDDYYTDLDKKKKFVSVFTGLEVLLKDNKPRKNIKGHLARECIKRISKNKQESSKIKSVIMDGYDYRSGILHDDLEIESEKLDNVLIKCVEYLCRL